MAQVGRPKKNKRLKFKKNNPRSPEDLKVEQEIISRSYKTSKEAMGALREYGAIEGTSARRAYRVSHSSLKSPEYVLCSSVVEAYTQAAKLVLQVQIDLMTNMVSHQAPMQRLNTDIQSLAAKIEEETHVLSMMPTTTDPAMLLFRNELMKTLEVNKFHVKLLRGVEDAVRDLSSDERKKMYNERISQVRKQLDQHIKELEHASGPN